MRRPGRRSTRFEPYWLSRPSSDPQAGPRDVAIIRTMIDLGLRVGEVARLNIDDVQTGALWILGRAGGPRNC